MTFFSMVYLEKDREVSRPPQPFLRSSSRRASVETSVVHFHTPGETGETGNHIPQQRHRQLAFSACPRQVLPQICTHARITVLLDQLRHSLVSIASLILAGYLHLAWIFKQCFCCLNIGSYSLEPIYDHASNMWLSWGSGPGTRA